jgi:hypothetical protein
LLSQITDACSGSSESARLITLTLPTTDEQQLQKALKQLTTAFARLRRSLEWKARIKGGVAVIQIERVKNGRGWLPHIHMIAWGRYMPARLLSAMWRRVTRQVSSVDVRQLPDARAVRRAAHYIARPEGLPQAAQLSDDQLAVLHRALRGKHLVISFGEARAKKRPPTTTRPCSTCGGRGHWKLTSMYVEPTEVQRQLDLLPVRPDPMYERVTRRFESAILAG